MRFLLYISEIKSKQIRFWFSPHRKTQETFSLEFQKRYISYICYKVDSYSESEIQTSMVTHTLNSCSTLPIQAHTYSSEHTHTVNTHLEQWAAIYVAVPGEQLGVRCLAQVHLVVVLKVERELDIHSPHLQSLPDRESNSQPFNYESDSLPLGHDLYEM